VDVQLMFERILVLTGGEGRQHSALQRALQCAATTARLEIFDVVYESLLEGYLGDKSVHASLRERVLAERRARAAELARAAASKGRAIAVEVVWAHPLQDAVATEVIAKEIDLVVAAPLLEGSGGSLSHSDWQLLLTCPAPVLLVRSNAEKAYGSIIAAVDPLHAHAKPADLDEAILRIATAVRERTGASLTALHCYPPGGFFGAEWTQHAAPDAAGGDVRRRALEALLTAAGVEAGAGRLVEGAPHAVLRSMADRNEADLIVMGALSRGRLKHLVLGSTAERVLQRGLVDVLIVKPSGRLAAAGPLAL
jgi:universal stress protein E